jgi:phosphate transport system substrate-binding protein
MPVAYSDRIGDTETASQGVPLAWCLALPLLIAASLAAGCSSSRTAAGPTVQLEGAGATFPAVLYKEWATRYERENPDVSVFYNAVGSGRGVRDFLAEKGDFAASDSALTDEEMAGVGRGALLVPAAAGLVALAYNLPGVTDLKLSREAYAGIFLGTVTRWNDPAIAKHNPGKQLPDLEIQRVVRADGSGTTFIFTNHLSAVSEEWREKVGAGRQVRWPGRPDRHPGNDRVGGAVSRTVGSIGYVDGGTLRAKTLTAALLENKAGQFVEPLPLNATFAFNGVEMPSNLRLFLPDPPGKDAYPIVGFTWLLAYKRYDDPEKARALRAFLKWCLKDGQDDCRRLGYVRLHPDVVRQTRQAVDQIGE